MKRIPCLDALLGRIHRCDVEPFLFVDVPGNPQHLDATIWEFDHILLQWSYAEGVFDFVVVVLAVGAFGVHHELFTVAEETSLLVEASEFGIIEIAEHRFVGRQFHGAIVIRTFPQFVLDLMARDAGFAAHVLGVLERVNGNRTVPISRRPGDEGNH
jgi:hypothetical protein